MEENQIAKSRTKVFFFTEKKRFFFKLILKSFVYIHIDAYMYMQACSIVSKEGGRLIQNILTRKKKQTKEGKIGLLPIILKIIIRLGNSMFIYFFKYKL